MAKTDFKSVDDYIAARPENIRQILLRVRAVIREALPEAEEVISYQIPAYRVNGRVAIYFAGWKEHFSVYPATGKVPDVFAKELAGYEMSKGTIRFPYDQPLPKDLIAGIAKLKAEEAMEGPKARRRKSA